MNTRRCNILAQHDIHVWTIDLDAPLPCDNILEAALSAEELARAAKFRSAKHRIHWMLSRFALRNILAGYCNLDAGDICFQLEENGKPTLKRPRLSPPLCFNLTHSADLALVAVTKIGPLGIDIEYAQKLRDFEQIISTAFSPSEQQSWRDLPHCLQQQAFYNGWTRKEAIIKATGRGFHTPLAAFDVSLDPALPPTLLADRENPETVINWHLTHLSPARDYTGALAIRLSGTKAPKIKTLTY